MVMAEEPVEEAKEIGLNFEAYVDQGVESMGEGE
jgi:hypothetical protein